MAVGVRDGVVHHFVHGQDHHGVGPPQPGLERPQGPRHQEQGGPRKDQEEDQGAEGPL